MLPLNQLQSWTQDCLLAPGDLPPHLASRIPQEILPSSTLSPAERLDIYRGMYEARLHSALKIDYPLLHHSLGEDLFAQLTHLYIAAHPSRSYTLNRLGDHLPAFLPTIENLPRAAFHLDLARFELLATEVFDAPESPAAPLPSPDQLPSARFTPLAALRSAAFRYPVHRYASAFRESGQAARPRPAATHLIIYRRDYQLHFLPLSPAQLPLFHSLSCGVPVEDALAASPHLRPSEIRRSFSTWFSAGLFTPLPR